MRGIQGRRQRRTTAGISCVRCSENLVVALPAAAAEEHAVAVATQISAVLAEVLVLQRDRGHVPCAAGVVHDARFPFAGRGFGEEGDELLGKQEMREVVRLNLNIIA